ncbi:MAG: hypothetical protein ACI9U2_002078 [Bradymonadia bacterium]|jgi:hypothetical protein
MICTACARPTSDFEACTHCGATPKLDGRFALQAQVRADLRGELYDALDGETPVRVRLSAGPDEATSIVWGEAAEHWLSSAPDAIAPPIAWGKLSDGRWYRVEAPVTGAPLRRGGSSASVLALVDALLARVAELHAAGMTHGGLSAQSAVRSEERGLVLTDFGPDSGTPAGDLLALARLAEALASEPFDASINAVLTRMRALDPTARPSAADALQALRDAVKWRRAPVQAVEPPRSSITPLFVILLAAVGAWYWLQGDDDAEFWQGELAGEVWKTTGDAPTRTGRGCTVSVIAGTQARNNCQVRVQCGESVIYGDENRGYARCVGSPVYALDALTTDKDADPRLELAAARGRVVVSDERHGAWSVTIGLNVEALEE